MPNDTMIAALRRERESYERRGLADRVALVDEQLAHHGWTGEDAPARADAGSPEGDPAPEGRTADAGQQTADAEDGKRGRGRPKLPRDEAGNIVRS